MPKKGQVEAPLKSARSQRAQPPIPPVGEEGEAPSLEALIDQALRSLAIDTPYYYGRLVGNRLELYLYGGRVLIWPIPEPPAGTG